MHKYRPSVKKCTQTAGILHEHKVQTILWKDKQKYTLGFKMQNKFATGALPFSKMQQVEEWFQVGEVEVP